MVIYATNYVRVMFIILMLTLYLRPIAVFGALFLGFTIAFNINTAMGQQRAAFERQQMNNANGRRGGGGGADPNPTPPMPSPVGSALAITSWLAVAYTKCLPIITLGISLASFVVLAHASLREAPSESRHRGRTPLSYTFLQVLGRRPAVPPGSDPRLVFKQLWHAGRCTIANKIRAVGRWTQFYLMTAWDFVRRPFVPALRNTPLATSWS